MKIILTNEVSGLGAAGDIVDVKEGYARNYLIPRGFAIAWTKGGEKDGRVDPPRPPYPRDRDRSSEANAVKGRLRGRQGRA